MIRGRNAIFAVLIVLISLFPLVDSGIAQEPIIRGVFIYSPSCPHCLDVINEVLPILDQEYGSQLVIFGFNTYTDIGNQVFNTVIDTYGIPPERQAVPTLIIGDQVLVGGFEIPEYLPAIIEGGLANGGIDWPAIPGLEQAMLDVESGEGESSSSLTQPMSIWDKFTSDLVANSLSVIILIGMIGAVTYAGINLQKDVQPDSNQLDRWLIPLLSLIGIAIAGYMSYVEFYQVDAVCGPVGSCNTVQQSSYATLFGVIPIGFLGLLGYLTVIILWLVGIKDSSVWKKSADTALWIVTLIGTLFSIYLTFLEPFVIGATCIWCLTSAVLMTFLFLLATRRFKIS
ncbi:MAG: vitamin K epoxide reductase family protein [Gammaproteobacteria bacterium]|nr:vitamin K epoxide reductase family protein [Gammaproteobacteria bacterium]